jgi:hypothetical protein
LYRFLKLQGLVQSSWPKSNRRIDIEIQERFARLGKVRRSPDWVGEVVIVHPPPMYTAGRAIRVNLDDVVTPGLAGPQLAWASAKGTSTYHDNLAAVASNLVPFFYALGTMLMAMKAQGYPGVN